MESCSLEMLSIHTTLTPFNTECDYLKKPAAGTRKGRGQGRGQRSARSQCDNTNISQQLPTDTQDSGNNSTILYALLVQCT